MNAALTKLRSKAFMFFWQLWLFVPTFVRRRVYIKAEKRYGSMSRLPLGLRLKRSRSDPNVEANSLRFILNNTTIPVPRVLDVLPFHSDEYQSAIIIMEWVEGEMLSSYIHERTEWSEEFHREIAIMLGDSPEPPDWDLESSKAFLDSCIPKLNLSDSEQLIDDLRNMLTQLHSIPSPNQSLIANINGGSLYWTRCLDYFKMVPPMDPSDFRQYLFQEVLYPSRLPHIMESARSVLRKDYRLCFTHADLNATNILVKDSRLAGVIDWESAGWFPEYWEYTMLTYYNLSMKPIEAFWKHVNAFGMDYWEELAFERILWQSTGITARPLGQDPMDNVVGDI